LDPETSVGAPGQVTVFQRLASDFVDDRVCQVRGWGLGVVIPSFPLLVVNHLVITSYLCIR
jgi:hypothetical protein